MTNDLAKQLMLEFADSTGLSRTAVPRRYLWTDAFALCNFLGLYRHYRDERYLKLAERLVDQVHHVLGRHRDDDSRCGWISGLAEQEGELHPTRGGLRIGKSINERGPSELPDSDLEWDRDGQYFHYLTKWMHALHRISRETGEHRYQQWAVELAVTAHDAFAYVASPAEPKRMVWKMSIDLSRPLVSSMGHHDPLDGLITYLELQSVSQVASEEKVGLTRAITDTTRMCETASWATDDPLGIGGLLDNATRLTPLVFENGLQRRGLLRQLLIEAEMSLQSFNQSSLLSYPADYRLAFRELGLAIGVRGLTQIRRLVDQDDELTALVNRLLKYQPLAERIQAFWSDEAHHRSSTWTDHCDINMVMLATSIAPCGYLGLETQDTNEAS